MISIYRDLHVVYFTEIVKKVKTREALCQIFQKAHRQTFQDQRLSLLKGLKENPLV